MTLVAQTILGVSLALYAATLALFAFQAARARQRKPIPLATVIQARREENNASLLRTTSFEDKE